MYVLCYIRNLPHNVTYPIAAQRNVLPFRTRIRNNHGQMENHTSALTLPVTGRQNELKGSSTYIIKQIANNITSRPSPAEQHLQNITCRTWSAEHLQNVTSRTSPAERHQQNITCRTSSAGEKSNKVERFDERWWKNTVTRWSMV